MTHTADRPRHHHHHEHRHHHPDERWNRSAGARTLDRVAVYRPDVGGSDRENSLTDQLRVGARAAALNQIRGVRQLNKSQTGREFPLDESTVGAAYIAQKARLNDSEITDDMTRSQLTNELLAKAILFAPRVSEALRTHHRHESKVVLSQYNDILGDIVRSLPAKLAPGYKTAIMDTLKLESFALNRQIGHSSEISGKDDAGLEVLRTMMNGVSGEIAPENAMRTDPSLEVTVPKDTESDLTGIDMMVTRKQDGKTILIDTKGHGKYLSTIAKHEGVDWVDESVVGPYYFTGMHETGHPHYLLNAGAFSQIPAESFDYTPAGQAKVLRTVHQMLDA